MKTKPRIGLLFDYDWDAAGFARSAPSHAFDRAGFDLFSFPSNARLVNFDLQRFAAAQARRARRLGWAGVVSHHEQFGALAAALVAEAAQLPGARPEAVIACQHKLYARQVLQQVCPQANVSFEPLPARYGQDIPEGLAYPRFAKPIKAAFSVLARQVNDRAALRALTRFGTRELWVIRHLVEPFERVARARMPHLPSAHGMLLEEPVRGARQYNLDGWVQGGRVHVLGVVDSILYPGTQAFMRFDHPSHLPAPVVQQALHVAQTFLAAVGFDNACFNMEFFHDAANGRLAVIEFNPRLASQFSDLYLRVQGIDSHALSLALATGADAAALAARSGLPKRDGAASSFVYRSFTAQAPAMPSAEQVRALKQAFPDALLLTFPKNAGSIARDFKWLGSYRYGILHLGGRDAADLRERCERASALLGWPPPYAGAQALPGFTPGWFEPGQAGARVGAAD